MWRLSRITHPVRCTAVMGDDDNIFLTAMSISLNAHDAFLTSEGPYHFHSNRTVAKSRFTWARPRPKPDVVPRAPTMCCCLLAIMLSPFTVSRCFLTVIAAVSCCNFAVSNVRTRGFLG